MLLAYLFIGMVALIKSVYKATIVVIGAQLEILTSSFKLHDRIQEMANNATTCTPIYPKSNVQLKVRIVTIRVSGQKIKNEFRLCPPIPELYMAIKGYFIDFCYIKALAWQNEDLLHNYCNN